MKNIKLLSILFILVVAISCNDEYELPFEFSDVEWTISAEPVNSMLQIAQEDYISFMDLSQGALTHKWTIDQGCLLLDPSFTKEDSVYTDFIIPDAGSTTNDANIHVLFTEPGLKSIHLYNTFDSEVKFFADEDTITSTRSGDVWVIDTTFMVDVYATIKPAFRIYQGETMVLEVLADDEPDAENQSGWAKVTLEVGQKLTYFNMTSVGRPTQVQWDVEDGAPATSRDSLVEIAFFKMGTSVGGSITSKRTGEFVPAGSATKVIPLLVEVIQSSEPFEFAGKAKELENGNIAFNVSGEVAAFSGEEANFSVHVVNKAAGFDEMIEVKTAKVSSIDATLIELELATPVFNTDSITIAYSGGAIKSLDLRELQPFTDQLVTMYIGATNVLNANFGFETATTNVKHGYSSGFWVGKQAPVVYARTEDKSASGNASMSYTSAGTVIDKKIYMKTFLAAGAVAPAGPFIEKIKVYIDENSDLQAFRTYMGTPWYTNAWDIRNVQKGIWVTLSKKVIIEEAPTEKYGLWVSPEDNPDASGDHLIYFDDMELIPLEPRQ